MDKEEKEIVLNSIVIFIPEIEKLFERLKGNTRSGKHILVVGKPSVDWLIIRLEQLKEALEDYQSSEFTLDDLQDYKG